MVITITKAIPSVEFSFYHHYFFSAGTATVNTITVIPVAELAIKTHSILELWPLGSWGKEDQRLWRAESWGGFFGA